MRIYIIFNLSYTNYILKFANRKPTPPVKVQGTTKKLLPIPVEALSIYILI